MAGEQTITVKVPDVLAKRIQSAVEMCAVHEVQAMPHTDLERHHEFFVFLEDVRAVLESLLKAIP